MNNAPKSTSAFQARFTEGLLRLIATTGLIEATDGTRAVVIPADKIIDIMITFMGILLRDSEGTSTPGRTRRTADQLARKLQRRINEAKDQESPFETITARGLN